MRKKFKVEHKICIWMFNLFLVPRKISSNFNTCFFLSLGHLCKVARCTFFSLLDVEMKKEKMFSFSLWYSSIFLLCLISRLFQGFKTACKTVSIMPVEVDSLHRPQRMCGFVQRFIWKGNSMSSLFTGSHGVSGVLSLHCISTLLT